MKRIPPAATAATADFLLWWCCLGPSVSETRYGKQMGIHLALKSWRSRLASSKFSKECFMLLMLFDREIDQLAVLISWFVELHLNGSSSSNNNNNNNPTVRSTSTDCSHRALVLISGILNFR
ncbi:hypothetical protein BO83DRAFT_201109 [Aspergillus eucalypticola CBS 122712]|uniref:Uncharacterized protein n=1 Tax=Aspergillus eucalypticola (strain CBS 122712 / IBT 29274) TaxID=1448314 RepID=A0A317W4R2_ASPEC|nr:uncharacterized protein BO83DRAFT_201109 [Aspergillus eucalypticola CBS 122712]PWY80008.1 hypothetical protein BO83DRAFT_201109 [Aspergillus eucalypticola CBS 122712]